MDLSDAATTALRRRWPGGPPDRLVLVDPSQQRLWLLASGAPVASWPCSTSRHGLGCREGSHRTPVGLHRVAEKIGEGAAVGAVFLGRKPTGEVVLPGSADPGRDAITTRILWLEGLEDGLNAGGTVDTRSRYIYIHGTPHEGQIGSPASRGCVRMRNADVIELFERTPTGTHVLILAD